MSPVRVLVVDDAVVVRRVVSDVLGADPEIEVIGAASNGRLGLEKFQQLRPDVVVLDIEMPEMDGITALKEIRKIDRRVPVVMFSTLTERGAAATLEALASGASDYCTKPTNSGSIAGAVGQLKADLVPRVKQLGRRYQAASPGAQAHGSGLPGHSSVPGVPGAPGFSGVPGDAPSPRSRRDAFAGRPAAASAVPAKRPGDDIRLASPAGPSARVDLVAIGISTGGPNALAELIPALPGALAVPVVIVQHMPPTFTRLLAERLDRTSQLKVVEAVAGMPVRPGEVYLAPGDFHMVVKRVGASVVIDLNQAPPENSCRPAVDVLFRSVAECFGPNALGLVLTGMGSDGLHGAELMHSKGARILAQDEESSVVWGMPGYVARAGVADAVLPLRSIAPEIVKRTVRGSLPAQRPAAHAMGGIAR